MFHEESSLRHPANRNRIDALLSDVTVQPMAFASQQQFIRFQQNHQGLPVFGASVLVGVDEKNQVRMVTSGLRPSNRTNIFW